ncbi:MAG: hypothetical protein R2715_12455 [Ilumatobacteraceae bacterium]
MASPTVDPGVVSITDAAYRRTIRTCGHGGVVEVAALSGPPGSRGASAVLVRLMDLMAEFGDVFRLDHVDDHLPAPWSPAEEEVVRWAEGEDGDTSEILQGWIAEHGDVFPAWTGSVSPTCSRVS